MTLTTPTSAFRVIRFWQRMLCLVLAAAICRAQNNFLDPDFRFELPSRPSLVAPTPDGKYLVAGPFSVAVNDQSTVGLVRLLNSGSIDHSFRLGSGVPMGSSISGIFPIADGRAIVHGAFTAIGGLPRPGIARLLADGSVDASFAPPMTLVVRDAIATPGGLVWVRSAEGALQLRDDGSVNADVRPIQGAELISTDSRDRLLVALPSSRFATVHRFLPSGAEDPTYASSSTEFGTPALLRFLRGISGGAGVYYLRSTSTLPLPLNIRRFLPDGGTDPNYGIDVGRPDGSNVYPRPDGTIHVVRYNGVTDTYSPTGEFQRGVYLPLPDPRDDTVLAFDPDGSAITTQGRIRPIVGSCTLSNVSLRANVATASDPLIAGFTLRGAGTAGMLVRAIGPGLAPFGVAGTMPDPQLSIMRDGREVAANDNWNTSSAAFFTEVGAFLLPNGSKDAAVHLDSTDGGFSGVVTPVAQSTGTALAEVYQIADTSGSATVPQLVNVSGRGPVTKEHALIAGFTLAGSGTARLLIRAVGPTLSNYGVTSPLNAPLLVLYRGSTALCENTGWSSEAEARAAAASAGAFQLNPNSNDGAMVVTLPAGSYTAVVTSNDGTPGVALAEIYLLQ